VIWIDNLYLPPKTLDYSIFEDATFSP